MTEQSMVERVERAIFSAHFFSTKKQHEHWQMVARAAIEAIKDKGDLPLAVTQAGGSVMLKYDYLPDVAGKITPPSSPQTHNAWLVP